METSRILSKIAQGASYMGLRAVMIHQADYFHWQHAGDLYFRRGQEPPSYWPENVVEQNVIPEYPESLEDGGSTKIGSDVERRLNPNAPAYEPQFIHNDWILMDTLHEGGLSPDAPAFEPQTDTYEDQWLYDDWTYGSEFCLYEDDDWYSPGFRSDYRFPRNWE